MGNTTPLVAEDSVPFVTSLKAQTGSAQTPSTVASGKVKLLFDVKQ
jgi:hypothetical protein